MFDSTFPTKALADISVAIKDGSHGTHKRVSDGIPFLSAKNITDRGQLQWDDLDDKISHEDYSSLCSSFTPEQDDLLLTVVGTLGRRALFNGNRVAFQRSVAFVRPDRKQVEPRYLYHAAASPKYIQQLIVRSNATAQAGLYLGELGKTFIPLPHLNEQACIAAVLDTIDETIARTEAVIAKLKQVRGGLLHDLLTCGLDEHGQLRDPVAYPGHFKDSPLGRIPKDWEVASLARFVPTAEYGISSSLGSKGIPILRMNNFAGGEAKLDDLKYSSIYIPHTLMLKPGDVLFNRTNSWEHVGRTGIWRGQITKASFASYLVRLNPRQDLLNPELLNYWLNWTSTQIRMRRYATPAVQQVNINPTNLRMMDAAFPSSLDEQSGMIAFIQGVDSAILSAQAELMKLRNLNSGLNDDLLAGRVSVPEGLFK